MAAMSQLGSESAVHPNASLFATTHWSVVLAAKEIDSGQVAEALETLCRTYWPPIYAFTRRMGYDPATAQDLTQEFFSQFLAKDYLGHLRHQKGKFRSFLLTFLKHFLGAERAKARAQKRGGGKMLFSLDACSVEELRLIEAVPDLSAEQAFDLRWAQTVLENSLQRLREKYATKGKGALFERLKDLRPGERGELTYAELGASLNMTEEAIKTAVLRLRRRQGEILREEIAHTVTSAEDIEEEIRHFMAALRA
jgi:RNA polymerase sigma factor (sigma-70 family)